MPYRPSPNPVLRIIEALGTFTAFLGLSVVDLALRPFRRPPEVGKLLVPTKQDPRQRIDLKA